jgi:peptidoglycan/xylan/chitin deacetylase (PgdA/CDA1 family)
MIERLRKPARRLLASALFYSGFLWLITAVRFSRGGFVLTYHRVLPDGADTFSSDGIVVHPRTFARQMAFLKRHFRVLSLPELERHLITKIPLPPRSCIVTFDDGWYDNFEYALPILEKHEVPAVIFVATDYIGSSTGFWQERLALLMFHALKHGGPARALAEKWLPADTARLTPIERRTVIRIRVDKMKDLPIAQIAALEGELVTLLADMGVDRPSAGADRFMTWADVSQIARSSFVTIGCHGKTHSPLTTLDDDDTERELIVSRSAIAAATSRPVTAVAYPNGDFSDRVVDIALAAGYSVGFTTLKGGVNAETDPLRLPRINVHEAATSTMPEFLASILLIFQRLRRPPAALSHANTRH